MDTLLKKAGAMLPHLDLFTHMASLRRLLQLAAHMEERGDRVTLISQEAITLVGDDMTVAPDITTGKGAVIAAADAYAVVRALKGHDAPEYAVTREELAALNARAVHDIEAGPALAAFGETLARLLAGAAGEPAAGRPTAALAPAPGTSGPGAAGPDTAAPSVAAEPTQAPARSAEPEPDPAPRRGRRTDAA